MRGRPRNPAPTHLVRLTIGDLELIAAALQRYQIPRPGEPRPADLWHVPQTRKAVETRLNRLTPADPRDQAK